MLDHNLTTKLINLIEDIYDYIPLNIYQSATELAHKVVNTLNHARENKLTLEQEYLVESIITTELPNIFETYKKISKHSKEAITKANNILQEQILLLNKRIHNITTERDNIIVQNMESHLAYLKTIQPELNNKNFHINLP